MMNIRTKLLLAISMFPLIILLLLGISWTRISSIDSMGTALQENYNISDLAEQIHLSAKEQGIILRNIVILYDENAIQSEIAHLQTESDLMNKNIELLESELDSPQQKHLVYNLKTTIEEYTNYKNSVINDVLEEKREVAIDTINRIGMSLQNQFSENSLQLSNSYSEYMKTSINSMSEDLKKQIIVGSIIFMFFVMGVFAIMSRIVWSVTSRLNNTSKVMSGIADGSASLSTKIKVIANDELDRVAHSFNTMVESLDVQIKKEKKLIWIKSNIADITTSLTGVKDLETLSKTFLSKIVPLLNACHAVFYIKDSNEKVDPTYKLLASYAFKERKHASNTFHLGEGLIGQAAIEKSPIILTNVPSDYITVKSGLGEASPLSIYVLPVSFEGDVKGVLELASFNQFSESQQTFLEEMIDGLGIILESVMGRIRLGKLLEETQELMEEIQAQSEELQSQQDELRATNEELEEQTQGLRESEEKLQIQQEELEQTNIELKEKADTLETQNKKFEQINREVERARAELEEKAQQLAISSKYKSEFLANMSHELRTPLNSLLILSKLLSDNLEGNLSEKQVEYSKTIYSSGKDLLSLINDILDLTKVESGKMLVNPDKVMIQDLIQFVEKGFKPIANDKNVDFNIVVKDGIPSSIYSDEQRIGQVLKNLLSNAFKFTERGEVNLVIDLVSKINNNYMLSFSVSDTGIGIPKEKQELIFQAFQQADGSTSRRFGGSGLGLSICREISILLGGHIVVESEEGKGSVFTFYVGDYQENPAGIEKNVQETTDEDVKSNQTQIHTPIQMVSESIIERKSEIKRLLLVDYDLKKRNCLMELIGDQDVILKAVSTGSEAIEELRVNQYDCLFWNFGLSVTTGIDFLEKIKGNSANENLKVWVYSIRDLSTEEETVLNKYAQIVIKKDNYSPEHVKLVLEEFLSNANAEAVDDQVEHTKQQNLTDLVGKKILLIDDDVRNVYAISSILEIFGVEISFAENGKEGVALLEKNANIDLVLMDIMMPEMDGYDAMRKIRENEKFKNLPIIALTAKAMKDDREKCIEAGATDYIVKPIEPDQLISLIRVWLYKSENI